MWAHRKDRLVDDWRWTRLGVCPRMATSIGLQHARKHNLGDGDDEKLVKNDLRTRTCLIVLDSR